MKIARWNKHTLKILPTLNSIGNTLASYPASAQLEEFLITRLNQDNPNVKFKCLVIIKVSLCTSCCVSYCVRRQHETEQTSVTRNRTNFCDTYPVSIITTDSPLFNSLSKTHCLLFIRLLSYYHMSVRN